MKKVFVFCAAVIFTACSSDDKPTYVPMPTGTTTVPSKITTQANGSSEIITYTFTYDDEKRIKTLTEDGPEAQQLYFTYTADDQIETIAVTGFEPGLWAFTYDVFMRMEGLTHNGQPGLVGFNAETEEFQIGSIKFKYKDNGDLDYLSVYKFVYDSTHKGAFWEIPTSYQIYGYFSSGILIQSGSKLPMAAWNHKTTNAPVNLFTNTYNTDGFVSQSIVSGIVNMTIKYEYIKI